MKSRIFGFIPARMAASRFPGKPMHPLLGRPMLEHVYLRSALFPDWHDLSVCTCDTEIDDFCKLKKIPNIMTSHLHTRAMDRVAEAAARSRHEIHAQDLIVMIQGDEPMCRPDMVSAILKPLVEDPTLGCSVLAMEIHSAEVWKNPDTVKIIHNLKNEVLYTTRAPVPHCKEFSPSIQAKRIYGIFAFRKDFLIQFTNLPPSPLELIESCDSNRILDHGLRQKIAPYPCIPSYSVDSPADAHLVEQHLEKDLLWGKY